MLDHIDINTGLISMIQEKIKALKISDDSGIKRKRNSVFKLKNFRKSAKKNTRPMRNTRNPFSTNFISLRSRTVESVIKPKKKIPKPDERFIETKKTASDSDKENFRGFVDNDKVQGSNGPIDEAKKDEQKSIKIVPDSIPTPPTSPSTNSRKRESNFPRFPPQKPSKKLRLHSSKKTLIISENPPNPSNFECPNCGELSSSFDQSEIHLKSHELEERMEFISGRNSFETIPNDYFLKKYQKSTERRKHIVNCMTCALKFQKLKEYFRHVRKYHNKSIKNEKISTRKKSKNKESFRGFKNSLISELIMINHNVLLEKFELKMKKSGYVPCVDPEPAMRDLSSQIIRNQEVKETINEDSEYLEVNSPKTNAVKSPQPPELQEESVKNVDEPKKSILKSLLTSSQINNKTLSSKKVSKNLKKLKIINIMKTFDKSTELYRLSLIKNHRLLFNLMKTLQNPSKLEKMDEFYTSSYCSEFCEKKRRIVDVNDNDLEEMNLVVESNSEKSFDHDDEEKDKNLKIGNDLEINLDVDNHLEEYIGHVDDEEKDTKVENDCDKSFDHSDDEESLEDCPLCLKEHKSEEILHHLISNHLLNKENFGKLEDMKDEQEAAKRFVDTCKKEYLSSIYDYWGCKVQNKVPEVVYCLKCDEMFSDFYDYKIHNAENHDLFCVMCDRKFDEVFEALGHKIEVHKSVWTYVWFVDCVVKSLAGTRVFEGVGKGREDGIVDG